MGDAPKIWQHIWGEEMVFVKGSEAWGTWMLKVSHLQIAYRHLCSNDWDCLKWWDVNLHVSELQDDHGLSAQSRLTRLLIAATGEVFLVELTVNAVTQGFYNTLSLNPCTYWTWFNMAVALSGRKLKTKGRTYCIFYKRCCFQKEKEINQTTTRKQPSYCS